MSLDPNKLKDFVKAHFDQKVLPSLKGFVEIPNISHLFDPDWKNNKFLINAAKHIHNYAENLLLDDFISNIYEDDEEDITPIILMAAQPFKQEELKKEKTILIYGHFDKQPPSKGWTKGDNYKPYVDEDKQILYGRGGNDDGYSFYAALTALSALQYFKIPYHKIIIYADGCEESGSPHLSHWLTNEVIKSKIGTPDLIICLDSGAADFKSLWSTNSLRGVVAFDMTVKTLNKGIDSGKFSGIVPDSFMIARKIISNFEKYKPESNSLSLKDFETEIPKDYEISNENTCKQLGDDYYPNKVPGLNGIQLLGNSTKELFLNGNWKPSLTVTGISGLPQISSAGSILRPSTTVRVSIRTPPNFDVKKGQEIVKKFKENPPFNSSVTIEERQYVSGWHKQPGDAFKKILSNVSTKYFEKDWNQWGVGGSIPFVQTLTQMFPNAEILVTGAGSVDSNCHAPDENLNLEYCKQVICALTDILAQVDNL